MVDVAIDYATIQTVCGALNNAVTNIVPELTSLQTQVDGLLQQDGGLWLSQTSPALQTSYHTFSSSLTNPVNGITNFAQQFSSIGSQMKDMDTQMANSVKNPTSG
jgi:hypothetical protein